MTIVHRDKPGLVGNAKLSKNREFFTRRRQKAVRKLDKGGGAGIYLHRDSTEAVRVRASYRHYPKTGSQSVANRYRPLSTIFRRIIDRNSPTAARRNPGRRKTPFSRVRQRLLSSAKGLPEVRAAGTRKNFRVDAWTQRTARALARRGRYPVSIGRICVEANHNVPAR